MLVHCYTCGSNKEETEFYFYLSRTKCKKCIYQKQKEKRLQNPKWWDARNRAYQRNSRKKHKTNQFPSQLVKSNISALDYLELKQWANGLCEICKQPEARRRKGSESPTALCLDHCHKTGKHRGFLCHHCNTGLGQFKDNPKFLQEAIEYLKKSAGE
jgi:hypothetical protein